MLHPYHHELCRRIHSLVCSSYHFRDYQSNFPCYHAFQIDEGRFWKRPLPALSWKYMFRLIHQRKYAACHRAWLFLHQQLVLHVRSTTRLWQAHGLRLVLHAGFPLVVNPCPFQTRDHQWSIVQIENSEAPPYRYDGQRGCLPNFCLQYCHVLSKRIPAYRLGKGA